MGPSPFVSRYLLEWFAAQTMQRAQKMVVDEVKNRVETGDLGDYDGLIFKDAFRSKNAGDRIAVGAVDLGVVVATKAELVGVLDKMGTPKQSKGGEFRYYSGTWRGFSVVCIVTGHGAEAARLGTEALLQAFRPARVACIGFARALVDSLKPGALFVPDRLMREDGSSIDLSQRTLPAPVKDEEEIENKPTAEQAPGETSETAENASDGSDVETAQAEATQAQEQAETPENATEKETVNEEPKRFVNTDSPVYAFLKKFATGALISVDRETVKKSERKRFADEFGAMAMDRETIVVAEVCGEAGVPFLPLRAIYDLKSQAGSKEAERAIRNEGRSMARTLGALFGAVSKRPSAALDMYKLKEQSLEAADKLAKALGNILAMAQDA